MVQLEEEFGKQVEVPTPSSLNVLHPSFTSTVCSKTSKANGGDARFVYSTTPSGDNKPHLFCDINNFRGMCLQKDNMFWLLSNFFTVLCSKKIAEAAQSAISCGHQNHVLVKTARSPFDCRDIRRKRLNSWLEKDCTPL